MVLYELLCGATPFSGPPAMVISLVINQEPPSPRKENPAIPKDLETICLKAMSKKREHRYANCQAMAEDLRRWLSGEPITARRVGSGRAVRALVPAESGGGRVGGRRGCPRDNDCPRSNDRLYRDIPCACDGG